MRAKEVSGFRRLVAAMAIVGEKGVYSGRGEMSRILELDEGEATLWRKGMVPMGRPRCNLLRWRRWCRVRPMR